MGVVADDNLALAGLAEAVAERGAEALGQDRENNAVAVDGAAFHDEVVQLLLVGVGPQVAGQGVEGRGRSRCRRAGGLSPARTDR